MIKDFKLEVRHYYPNVILQACAKGRNVTYPTTWVKLEKYAEITGDSVDAVMARRKNGKWLDGEQCKMVDGRLWVNLPAVDRWAEQWEPQKQYRRV